MPDLTNLDKVLDLLGEECSEVLQVLFKIRRYGLNNIYKDKPNTQHLCQEIADVQVVVELLQTFPELKLTNEALRVAQISKLLKLHSEDTKLS